MWAHQYLQAVNQIAAKAESPHVWTHDGDDAERFGLAPNFGCCTANMQQGWPKLVNNLLLTADGGKSLLLALIAPFEAETDLGKVEEACRVEFKMHHPRPAPHPPHPCR